MCGIYLLRGELYQDGLTNYLMTGAGSLLNRPIELTVVRSSGEEFRAELAITRVTHEESSGCTVLIRDITERKKAEAELRHSEERFRLLVESVKDYAIYMLDAQGRIVIPPPLRESAAIVGEVRVFGRIDYIEVWNEARFVEKLKREPWRDEDGLQLAPFGV